MKAIQINKGRQMAINQFTWFNSGPLFEAFIFTDSCRYLLPAEDQADWNKLFGASWGVFPIGKQFQMHENSSRWAWRYNPKTDLIELAPYYYSGGSRHYPENTGFDFVKVKIGEVVNLGIYPNKKAGVCDYYGPGYVYTAKQEIPSEIGFLAPLFFGGNQPAPHKIIVNRI